MPSIKRSLITGIKTKFTRDLLFLLLAAMAVFLTAGYYDLLEIIYDYARAHEEWELDEIITTSVFLVFGLAWFAWRRLQEARDINERLNIQSRHLEKALNEIKVLEGVLPICSSCKKIRDDGGHWHEVERYVHDHSQAAFSHDLCPDCVRKLYPDIAEDVIDQSLSKDRGKK